MSGKAVEIGHQKATIGLRQHNHQSMRPKGNTARSITGFLGQKLTLAWRYVGADAVRVSTFVTIGLRFGLHAIQRSPANAHLGGRR